MDDILPLVAESIPVLDAKEGVMEKRYRITLTEQERQDLQRLVSTGKGAAKKLVRARIVLLADQSPGGPAKSDPEVCDALCGLPRSSEYENSSWRRGLMSHCNPHDRLVFINGGWTVRRKPISWLWLAVFGSKAVRLVELRAAAIDGRAGIRGVSGPRDRAAKRLKNEPAVALEERLVSAHTGPSAEFGGDGRCVGCISSPLRS